MKHFFISLVLTFITSLSFAQPINLSLDKYYSNEMKAGDTFILSLNVEKYTHKISVLQVFLEFDQTALRYVKTVDVNNS